MIPGSWRIAAASATGTSHAKSGAPCQDSFRHMSLDTVEGTVVVVVACDGAGSAAHSEVGSRVAADAFVELVAIHFEAGGTFGEIDRDLARSWLAGARERVEDGARVAGQASRDHACTLVAAIVGEESCAFVQVGDGAIVVRPGEEACWAYVFWPQHGEFANTTNFIVSPDAEELMDFECSTRRVDEFAVFSDGIEKLVLHEATRSVHEPFFDAMFPPVRASVAEGADGRLSERLRAYLESPKVCERTDDDKTLVIATRRSAASAAAPA